VRPAAARCAGPWRAWSSSAASLHRLSPCWWLDQRGTQLPAAAWAAPGVQAARRLPGSRSPAARAAAARAHRTWTLFNVWASCTSSSRALGVRQVVQPFDAKKFNFTKALQKEVLFQFEARESGAGGVDYEPLAPARGSPNLVFINVSPIEYGHVLLVPRALSDLPQVRPRPRTTRARFRTCCRPALVSAGGRSGASEGCLSRGAGGGRLQPCDDHDLHVGSRRCERTGGRAAGAAGCGRRREARAPRRARSWTRPRCCWRCSSATRRTTPSSAWPSTRSARTAPSTTCTFRRGPVSLLAGPPGGRPGAARRAPARAACPCSRRRGPARIASRRGRGCACAERGDGG